MPVSAELVDRCCTAQQPDTLRRWGSRRGSPTSGQYHTCVSWTSVAATSSASIVSALIGAGTAYFVLGKNIAATSVAARRKQSSDAARSALAAAAEFEMQLTYWMSDRDRGRIADLRRTGAALRKVSNVDALTIDDSEIIQLLLAVATLASKYVDLVHGGSQAYAVEELPLASELTKVVDALRKHIVL